MTLMSVKQNVDKLLCTNYPWFKPQLYKENSRRSRRLVKSNPLQKYYYLLKNMFVCLRIVKEISLNESGATRSTDRRSRLSVAAVIFCIVRDRHRKEGLSFIAFEARYAGDFKCYGWTLF